MAGQKRNQVFRHPNGSNARATAAVRDGKGLVQVEVAHVGTDEAWTRQAHLRIHVGAVHVHLPTVGVHELGNVQHRFLKHPVGGGVGDHQRAEF